MRLDTARAMCDLGAGFAAASWLPRLVLVGERIVVESACAASAQVDINRRKLYVIEQELCASLYLSESRCRSRGCLARPPRSSPGAHMTQHLFGGTGAMRSRSGGSESLWRAYTPHVRPTEIPSRTSGFVARGSLLLGTTIPQLRCVGATLPHKRSGSRGAQIIGNQAAFSPHRASSHRNHPKFDVGPSLDLSLDKSYRMQSTSTNFRPCRPNLARIRATLTKLGLACARIGPEPTTFESILCRIVVELGQFQTSARDGPNLARNRPLSANIGADSVKLRPEPATFGPTSARCRPNSAKLGPTSAKMAPKSNESGPSSAARGGGGTRITSEC